MPKRSLKLVSNCSIILIPTRLVAWDLIIPKHQAKVGPSLLFCLSLFGSRHFFHLPTPILHKSINDKVWCSMIKDDKGLFDVGFFKLESYATNYISKPSPFHRSHYIHENSCHCPSLLQFVKIHSLPWCHSAKVKIEQAQPKCCSETINLYGLPLSWNVSQKQYCISNVNKRCFMALSHDTPAKKV